MKLSYTRKYYKEGICAEVEKYFDDKTENKGFFFIRGTYPATFEAEEDEINSIDKSEYKVHRSGTTSYSAGSYEEFCIYFERRYIPLPDIEEKARYLEPSCSCHIRAPCTYCDDELIE